MIDNIMFRKTSITLCAIALFLTLWLMHYGSLTENSGALSKTGLIYPVTFTIWAIFTYFALHIHIIYGLKKINKDYKIFYILSALAGIGMLLTLACDFDYSLKVQYYLHCAGSLAFSSITGIMVFVLFLFQFHKSPLYKIFTIIIGLILLGDTVFLLIYQETALIEAVPILFGLITLPLFNFYNKDKEYAAR